MRTNIPEEGVEITEEYIRLKNREREIKTKIKSLQPNIIELMKKNNLTNLRTEFGKLEFKSKFKYIWRKNKLIDNIGKDNYIDVSNITVGNLKKKLYGLDFSRDSVNEIIDNSCEKEGKEILYFQSGLNFIENFRDISQFEKNISIEFVVRWKEELKEKISFRTGKPYKSAKVLISNWDSHAVLFLFENQYELFEVGSVYCLDGGWANPLNGEILIGLCKNASVELIDPREKWFPEEEDDFTPWEKFPSIMEYFAHGTGEAESIQLAEEYISSNDYDAP
jgi:hypothetical protein